MYALCCHPSSDSDRSPSAHTPDPGPHPPLPYTPVVIDSHHIWVHILTLFVFGIGLAVIRPSCHFALEAWWPDVQISTLFFLNICNKFNTPSNYPDLLSSFFFRPSSRCM